jgi:putative transposase
VECAAGDRDLFEFFGTSAVLEWTQAGVFEKAWVRSLRDYDAFMGIDWSWLRWTARCQKHRSEGKTGLNPTDQAKGGTKRSLLTEAAGIPVGLAVDGAN